MLTKAGLAREAQIDRNQITQGSCRDLGARFDALAEKRQAPSTALEVSLQARVESLLVELAALKEAQSGLREERDRWHSSMHTLLRAVQVLRLENVGMQSEIDMLKRRLGSGRDGATAGLYAVPPPP